MIEEGKGERGEEGRKKTRRREMEMWGRRKNEKGQKIEERK